MNNQFSSINFDDIFCQSNLDIIADILEHYDSVLQSNNSFNSLCHELSNDIAKIENFPEVHELFNKFEADCNKICLYQACLLYLIGLKHGFLGSSL